MVQHKWQWASQEAYFVFGLPWQHKVPAHCNLLCIDNNEGPPERACGSQVKIAHPRQTVLICKLLPQSASQGGQPGAGPIRADALVPYELCGQV